jgi:hypothetical protein
MNLQVVRLGLTRSRLVLRLALCAAVVALMSSPGLRAQTGQYPSNANISYLGNSYNAATDWGAPNSMGIPGSDGLWVPDQSDGLFELPNGTVFVNSVYDEGHRDAAIYTSAGLVKAAKNNGAEGSQPLYAAFGNTHTSGRTAGGGVTSDGTNAYLAVQQAGGFDTDMMTQRNCEIWQTVRKYDLVGNQITTSNTGNGPDGSFMIVSKTLVKDAPNYRGYWDINQTYQTNDSVLYLGTYWQAQANNGITNKGIYPVSNIPAHPDTAWTAYSCNSSVMLNNLNLSYSQISSRILAVAMLNSLVYVVDRSIAVGAGQGGTDLVTNTLRVFDPVALAEVPSAEINLGLTGVLTAMASRASDNTLWLTVAKNGPSDVTTTPTILRVTAPSGQTPTVFDMKVPNLYDPSAVAFDATGKLAVADNGAHQQIMFYVIQASSLSLFSTFGQAGGVFGTPGLTGRGMVGFDKFQGITGIGFASSNIMSVVCNSVGKYHLFPDATDPRYNAKQTEPLGSNLRFLQPVTKPQYSYSLVSQFQNSAYITTMDVDDNNDTQLYSSTGGFNFTYPADGQPAVWSQFAQTLDPVTYPLDPRINLGAGAPVLRRLLNPNSGKSELFMYTFTQYPDAMSIFRFDTGIAVPAAMIAFSVSPAYPPNHPPIAMGDKQDPWTWLNSSATAVNFAANEYTATPTINTFKTTGGHVGGWWVEHNGDVWVTNNYKSDQNTAIFHFALKGFNSNGSPNYGSWDDAVAYPIPALSTTIPDPTPYKLTTSEQNAYSLPQTNPPVPALCPPITPKPVCGDLCFVQRAIYDQYNGHDAMYLTGFTASDVAAGYHCGVSPSNPGPTVIKYLHWSTNPTAVWKSAIPWITTTGVIGTSYLTLGSPTTFSLPLAADGTPGNYLFVGYGFDTIDQTVAQGQQNTGTVLVIEAVNGLAPDGSVLGKNRSMVIVRGGNGVAGNQVVGNDAGIIDTSFGINAHIRTNGANDLFTEDDSYGKVVVLSNVIR